MNSDFEKFTPNSFTAACAERRGREYWRVTIWRNGRPVIYKDFLHEALATGWADKIRNDYRAMKATGIFVKKTSHNQQQEK